MNPFLSSPYFYNPIYNYNLYQPLPTNGNQFCHYFPPASYPLLQSNFYQQKIPCENLHTKPDVVKIEVIDSVVQPANHEATKQTKSKKLKNDNKRISNLAVIKVEEKPEKKSNIKVKYFDPSVAPLVTSQGYNQVLLSQKQQKYLDQRSQHLESNFDELAFPEEDEKPFIVFRYRRIKKRYKKYLQKYNSATAAEDDSSSDSQSSEVSQQKYSNSLKIEEKIENLAVEINIKNIQIEPNLHNANKDQTEKAKRNEK